MTAEGAGAAEELRRSEERFQLLVESVIDYAIFMLDPDGIIVSWNTGARRLKGYDEHQIIGQHYSIFYPEESLAQGLPAKLLAEARTEGRVRNQGWRVRRDGSRFWADVVITALYDERDELFGFAKVTRDMTDAYRAELEREQALDEQKRAVEDLQRLDRWRREFVRAIVHDLQSPVTGIRGFASLLGEDDLEPEDRATSLARIESNARSLQDLIDHLRTYTVLDAGAVELTRETVDLSAFVTALAADMQPVLADHPLQVDIDDVEVVADPRALERILRNLLSNAARHTPTGSGIGVAARQDGDQVEVEVTDEGGGIPTSLLERVFDRFEKGPGGGTGLGLSIVREYVELHGGAITAENRESGGAAIRFTLPRV